MINLLGSVRGRPPAPPAVNYKHNKMISGNGGGEQVSLSWVIIYE